MDLTTWKVFVSVLLNTRSSFSNFFILRQRLFVFIQLVFISGRNNEHIFTLVLTFCVTTGLLYIWQHYSIYNNNNKLITVIIIYIFFTYFKRIPLKCYIKKYYFPHKQCIRKLYSKVFRFLFLSNVLQYVYSFSFSHNTLKIMFSYHNILMQFVNALLVFAGFRPIHCL